MGSVFCQTTERARSRKDACDVFEICVPRTSWFGDGPSARGKPYLVFIPCERDGGDGGERAEERLRTATVLSKARCEKQDALGPIFTLARRAVSGGRCPPGSHWPCSCTLFSSRRVRIPLSRGCHGLATHPTRHPTLVGVGPIPTPSGPTARCGALQAIGRRCRSRSRG